MIELLDFLEHGPYSQLTASIQTPGPVLRGARAERAGTENCVTGPQSHELPPVSPPESSLEQDAPPEAAAGGALFRWGETMFPSTAPFFRHSQVVWTASLPGGDAALRRAAPSVSDFSRTPALRRLPRVRRESRQGAASPGRDAVGRFPGCDGGVRTSSPRARRARRARSPRCRRSRGCRARRRPRCRRCRRP